jgi:hypothetical protein
VLDTVYVESTVIGNIAGRLHPDPVISARQQITRSWWAIAPRRCRLFTSQLTLDECGDGDPDASAERLEIIGPVELLDTTDEAKALAGALMDRRAVPASQPRDALHVSIAAVHRIEFLVTWNFKHILNPHLQTKIAEVCRDEGYRPPVICTPQQLLESENDS